MLFLRQSTAVDVKVGPFVDSVDGNTEETTLTITQPDIRLSKNGGAFAQKNAAQTLSHDDDGFYTVSLDTTDTNTVGHLVLSIHETGALPVWHEFQVLEEALYDALFASGAAVVPANVTQFGGSAGTFSGGRPEVNTTHAAGTAWNSGAIGPNTLAADTITAAKIAADAIGASELAADAVTEIQTGLARAMVSGTADSGTTSSMVDAALTQADGYWDGALIVFTSGTLAGVSRRITRFRDGDNRVNFWPPTPVAVSTHTYEIWPAPAYSREVALSAEEMILITGHTGAEFLFGGVEVRGRLYFPTWHPSNLNTQVIRFNNPRTDLTDYDVVDLPNDGIHELAAAPLVYSPVTDLIYVLPQASGTNRVVVSSVDPDTLAVADVIDDNTGVDDDDFDSGGLEVVGDYLYVLTSTDGSASQILRYPLATYTRDTATALTGLERGNGLVGSHEFLVASGWTASGGVMARINLDAATFSTQALPSNQNGPGRAVIINDFAWFGFHTGSLAHAVARVWLRDITQVTTIHTGLNQSGSYGLVYALGSLWVLATGGAEEWGRINPDTLEVSYHWGLTQGGALTSVITDGQYLYMACDNALDDVHIARVALAPVAVDYQRSAAVGVWNAERAGYRLPGSFGQNLQPRFIGAASAGAAGTVTLGTASVGEAASAVDDEYNGLVVLIVAGTGVGQQRGITDYVGSTKVATVDGNWSTNPDNTSKLLII